MRNQETRIGYPVFLPWRIMCLIANTLSACQKSRTLPSGKTDLFSNGYRLLITGKVVSTKHGDPMEFLTFEDETGLVETTFFPSSYRKFCYMLDRTRPYILYGKVEEEFGAVTLTVEKVEAIGLSG